jgi:hypothetical protein
MFRFQESRSYLEGQGHHIKTMFRFQESRSYLEGQGHTNILKFYFIALRVSRYEHLCPDCSFVMHRRIL